MRAVVVALLLLVRVVHADVGVVVSGEPVMQAPLMAQLQGWLQTHDYNLVAAPLGTATNTFIDCFVIEDIGCAKRTFEQQSRATGIVYARADLDAGTTGRNFTLTAFWFVTGKEPVTSKHACKQCDDAQLAIAVDALLRELEKASGLGNGTLRIGAGAAGMTVTLDSIDVGAVPLAHELSPGKHELAFVHNGRVVDRRPVRIEPGATVEVTPPAIVAEPGAKRSSKTLPLALLISGAALAVTGGVFLYYGSLDGPNEPYVYTNANKIGAPTAVAGGVAIIAGGLLMLRGTF